MAGACFKMWERSRCTYGRKNFTSGLANINFLTFL